MIRQLYIENFALFRRTEFEFSPDFVVITGESGAGKSLAMEAVLVALGARLTADRIPEAGDAMRIRVTFEVPQRLVAVWETLGHMGIDPDDILIVERQASSDGKSLFRVQGHVVPSSLVRSLSEHLVQYTGQHQALRWADSGALLRWLDRFGGLEPAQEKLGDAYQRWKALDKEVSVLEQKMGDDTRDGDKRETLRQMKALNMTPGEDHALHEEIVRLRAGRGLVQGYASARAFLDGDENEEGTLAKLWEASRVLSALQSLDARVAPLTELVGQAQNLLDEANREIGRLAESLDLDPARLEQAEERADSLTRFKRRFGPELEDVLAYMEGLEAELGERDVMAWERERLEAEREGVYRELAKLSGELSLARQGILSKASHALTQLIREMEMPTGTIELRWKEKPLSTQGVDDVEGFFTASKGQPMKPINKVASGGELARVALALAVLGDTGDGATFLFDEVDAGLGGLSAERVAGLLKGLGGRTQVIVISHQPVVAAKASQHWVVAKQVEDGRSVSSSDRVEGKIRIQEVARMLSGTTRDVALRHAEVLLRDGGVEPL